MGWLRKLFGMKPECEHLWVLDKEDTYNITYTHSDSKGKQYHKVYLCSKCLKVKHITITT